MYNLPRQARSPLGSVKSHLYCVASVQAINLASGVLRLYESVRIDQNFLTSNVDSVMANLNIRLGSYFVSAVFVLGSLAVKLLRQSHTVDTRQ